MHASPEGRIHPGLSRCVERRVRSFRAKLTVEKLDGTAIDDSFGSLVTFTDSKWFATLLARHNDPGIDYHLDIMVFKDFVIGRDHQPAEDIVHLNISSLWFILNIIRNMEAG